MIIFTTKLHPMRTLVIVLISICIYTNASAQNSAFGRNIISISPIQTMSINHLDANYGSDVGVNLSYERISTNEYFGFKLPVSFSLKQPYYYFMPALKIYPFKQGPVKFAFGPQFYFASGEYDYNLNYTFEPYYSDTVLRRSRTQVGFLINTSVNFTILQNFFLGLDAGLGINYFDSNEDDKILNDYNDYYYHRSQGDFYPAIQLNFSMGYRF